MGHLVAADELLQLEHDALPRRQRRAAPGRESVLGGLHRRLELGRGRLRAARHHLLRGLAVQHNSLRQGTAHIALWLLQELSETIAWTGTLQTPCAGGTALPAAWPDNAAHNVSYKAQ